MSSTFVGHDRYLHRWTEGFNEEGVAIFHSHCGEHTRLSSEVDLPIGLGETVQYAWCAACESGLVASEVAGQNPLIVYLNILFGRLVVVAERKNADYTGGRGARAPLYNFTKCEEFGVSTEKGIMVRITDKMARIAGLIDGHRAKVEEPLLETIEDAINYLAILHYKISGGE